MINFLPKTVPKAPLILKNLKSQPDEPGQTKESLNLSESFSKYSLHFKVIFSFESKDRTTKSSGWSSDSHSILSLSDLPFSDFAFKNLIIRLNLRSSLCCLGCCVLNQDSLERFSAWKWAKLACQTELSYSARELFYLPTRHNSTVESTNNFSPTNERSNRPDYPCLL